MFSVVVMIPFKNISFEISAPYVVEVHHFIPAVFFSLVAIIIPIAINSIFYSLWFGKKSISKLWVRVPDVIFTLVILIIMCLNLFVFNNNWSEAEWVW
jgi:formate hydrogenlyase subunit 3/multisubunit Na+/H+ antiporter MnhD subunit